MPDTPLSLFISYSRTDSAFVDRLEADLKARNFQPWVDRRKLEGGQDWSAELEKAIDRCQLVLVVLSPEAMASKYVRREYRYADSLDKPIIPLNWRPTKVPFELNDIQWVNFADTYDQGWADLLVALSRQAIAALPPPRPHPIAVPPSISDEELPVLVPPQPAAPLPAADLNQLYRAGVAAKARNDLERTAIFWQQVLDRDPAFGNGTLAPQMQQLQAELHPIRVQRLRDQAEQAHRAGAWGQEIGAWQALLGLQPRDEQAQKRLPVAQQNFKYAWIYDNAQEFAKEKDLSALKTQLELLWRDAPYYGDPAGIANLAGLKVPPSFEQAITIEGRKEAEEAEAKRKREAEEAIRKTREEKATDRAATRDDNIDRIFGNSPVLVAICPFVLLAGVGVSVGALSQSWPWAVGTVAGLGVLAYLGGYQWVMSLKAWSIFVLIGAAGAFGIAWLLGSASYAHMQDGHTIGSQIIFGAVLGGLAGISVGSMLVYELNKGDFVEHILTVVGGTLLAALAGALLFWVVISAIGGLAGWSFGFGYGWNYGLLVGIPALIFGMAGLISSVYICWKATFGF